MTFIHGTCVAWRNAGVLLIGVPGAGKSDLALRLIDRGFSLIADDQAAIKIKNDLLQLSVPPAIAGQIEVRGIGILSLPYKSETNLKLVVQLVAREELDRMPEDQFWHYQQMKVPQIKLHAFDHSTPFKIQLALERICHKLAIKRDLK